MFVPVGETPTANLWKVNVASAGTHDVYMNWPATLGASSTASVTITHGGGTTVLSMSSYATAGWVNLGSYALDPSAGHTIELTGLAAGEADLFEGDVNTVPDGLAPNLYKWHPAIASSGTYEV